MIHANPANFPPWPLSMTDLSVSFVLGGDCAFFMSSLRASVRVPFRAAVTIGTDEVSKLVWCSCVFINYSRTVLFPSLDGMHARGASRRRRSHISIELFVVHSFMWQPFSKSRVARVVCRWNSDLSSNY